jgi:hypothetical protein
MVPRSYSAVTWRYTSMSTVPTGRDSHNYRLTLLSVQCVEWGT